MTTIQAWQHIYSNVEKERSPQGRGGFQTLFYSPGLTELEVEEMEGRLLYFASQVEPVKRLFFTTSTGKGVVAQIVFLSRPDQFGRGGRYLAHALAFAPEDLVKFEADPFRVFRQFSFITTVDQALAQGDFKTGNIRPLWLDLPGSLAGEVKAANNWSTPELKKLSLLALRVEQQTRERNAITVTGQPEQIDQVLEAAFLTVPISLRPACTFDTYFYRCNLVATYFWAIGLPEPPVSIKFAHVDGQAQTVQGEVPSRPETAYEQWVMLNIEAGQLAKLARRREQAFTLGEWLDGRAYDLPLLNQASSELIQAVFKASPQSVQEAVRRGVSQKLPAELVDRAAGQVYRQQSGQALYKQLRQGFEVPHLVEILYQSYAAENFTKPSRPEMKALESLLEQADHNMLRLFLAHWTNARTALPEALKWAEAADYHQFAETALRLNLVKPVSLFIPGRGDDFLDVYLGFGIKDLPNLVEMLIDAREFDCLPRLNNYLSDASPKELGRLAKLVADHDQIPESFQGFVAEVLAARPPETGLASKLRGFWRSLSAR
jgi:hypothetical protein